MNIYVSRKRHKDLFERWPPPTNFRLQKQPLTSCANILSLALWYSSSLSSIDLLLLSAFKRIRIWQGHTHTRAHIYFRSDVRDARLSHSYQHVRKLRDSLLGKKKNKKEKHLPCCLHDQSWSCLVSECNVSENPPLCHPLCAQRISDRVCWLWEFMRSLMTASY